MLKKYGVKQNQNIRLWRKRIKVLYFESTHCAITYQKNVALQPFSKRKCAIWQMLLRTCQILRKKLLSMYFFIKERRRKYYLIF